MVTTCSQALFGDSSRFRGSNFSHVPRVAACVQARLECRDGCNIAVLRCQPGHSCVDGIMSPCTAGTYRNTSYDTITPCMEVCVDYTASFERVT